MKTLTIGRNSSNDVVIIDSFVSGTHCSITLDDKGKFFLQDLGSSNGTFVNGQRIQQAWLGDNDEVRIGETPIPWQEYFESPNDSRLNGQVIRTIRLGRAYDNDAVIADEYVSSYHAEILVTDQREYLVRDLKSTNGTFVNDRRVSTALLNPGDRLRLARITLEWTMYVSAPAESETDGSERKRNILVTITLILLIIALILLAMWGMRNLKQKALRQQQSNEVLLMPGSGAGCSLA